MKINLQLCFRVRTPNIPVSVACCPDGTTSEKFFDSFQFYIILLYVWTSV
jgi:hypothetical protein